MIVLILSGVTAFPAETELRSLHRYLSVVPSFAKNWLQNVLYAIADKNSKYPMLAYGLLLRIS